MSNGQCVETVRLAGGRIGVRDSKAAEGAVLRFEPESDRLPSGTSDQRGSVTPPPGS